MEFLSDVGNGREALKPYVELFPGPWEFIAWGESADDRYQAEDCAFFFQRAKEKNAYALFLVIGEMDKVRDTSATASSIVAILLDPPTEDPNEIVPILLERYRDDGGKYIELYSRTGQFMLP